VAKYGLEGFNYGISIVEEAIVTFNSRIRDASLTRKVLE
jgi:hypothetical protein